MNVAQGSGKNKEEFDVIHPVVYINKIKWYTTPVQHNYIE
jgi:hypothetical protein